MAIALFAVVFAIAQALRARATSRIEQERLSQRAAHAASAEVWAARALQDAGYDVLGAQVRTSYVLLANQQEMVIGLRADYLVRRKGRTFVAEVKSGELAPSLETAATRRQLLEYLLAFDVDGVVLVDAEARRIQEVTFPSRIRTRLGA
jgi:hypothetical protein